VSTIEDLDSALAGRYSVDRQIGIGGMATVYLAQDLRHDRTVAIKVLHAELARTVSAERFLAEIRTTARLVHPNILPLHDSGSAGGFLYYVMPFVDGETLRARLAREKRLSVDESVRLIREAADALDYAHRRHVVHRDIKPENILLQSGHALLADFGIARALTATGSDRMTLSGTALGTPAYMSPEQAAGEMEIDGRSDLYSLATVLYEMLAGEPPFTGPTVESVIAQRFTQVAPRITVKRTGVPRAVEAAIAVALARAPEDRFATMERFQAALVSKAPAHDEEGGERSIAVLPFVNMSGDPANEFFSDGISEEIINALTQLRDLRVAARTSAFSFKGRNVDLREIGDQLGVATVLEGSVRQSGNRLRITAQLTSVADGYHLWSERYDRDLTDVFAIQDEIANAIAKKLQVRVDQSAELVKPATANVDAYSLYLKGRALELQRGPALHPAVECFEQAVGLDPGYAAAYAELAKSLILLSQWGLRHPRETLARASAASARALELDPSLDQAHVARALLAFLVEYDREGAARAWARAVELDPADPEARSLRAVYDLAYARGAFDDAIREVETALGADPLNVNLRAHLALMHGWKSDVITAEPAARRAIELGPNIFYAQWTLVHARMMGSDPNAAVAAAMNMLSVFGRNPWPMMALALASGAAGKREMAEAVYTELDARSRTEYVQPMVLALAALGAGRKAEVFRYLREAVEIRDPLFALVAQYWPPLAPVRGEPEFVEILRGIGWDQPFKAPAARPA
jgi:eukaryotic-like serine/threonine-protein kinase